MPLIMDSLILGNPYDRLQLSTLWGFGGPAAISRGIFTPKQDKKLIFFVTKLKQNTQTQYWDYIEGNILHMDGETNHSADERIINSSQSGDKIYLFYRERHHQPFIYFGEIRLTDWQKNDGDHPSRFTFLLTDTH